MPAWEGIPARPDPPDPAQPGAVETAEPTRGVADQEAQPGRCREAEPGEPAGGGQPGKPAHAGTGASRPARDAEEGHRPTREWSRPGLTGEQMNRPSRARSSGTGLVKMFRPSRGEKSRPSRYKAYSGLGCAMPAWAKLMPAQ
jgi:hypothetical protein